jgi:cytochrome c oxidase assembly factor CtaG
VSTGQPSLAQLLGSWRVDPVLLAPLAGAAVLYLGGARRVRRGWPATRSAAFGAGLLVLALALMSGIDGYSERLLSVHMLQHELLMLLAPALLVWGAPVALALVACPRVGRRAISALLRGRAIRVLTAPALGFGAFAGVTLATHLSGVYELALRDARLHALEHAAYLGAGLLFLAPLIGSDPLPRRPGPVARFAWLLAGMVAMAIPGALLAFQTTVRYTYYLADARPLHVSALADQHLAGAMMWIGGGLAMFALAATVVMQALLTEERRQRRRDALAEDAAPGTVDGAATAQGVTPR